ncbi:hypothetical protein [Dyadobacter crusticola]|uniref:hypothetical protein n=1 Tax=Dyadobacter crusticola TaxID=292407 RepID=UPI0012FCBAFC|nr:hypothetical protein [Dyadobacter crusticola]
MKVEERGLSTKLDVFLEYGTNAKNQRIIKDSSNVAIEFRSIAQLLNHMENNGWTYLNSLLTYENKNWPVMRYYFKKKE